MSRHRPGLLTHPEQRAPLAATSRRRANSGYQLRTAVIGLVVTALVIAAVAIAILVAGDALGPTSTVEVTATSAQQLCHDHLIARSTGLTDPEFTDVVTLRSQTGWRVTGTMSAVNVHGARLARDYQCLVERVQGTWGVSSTWTSHAS